MNPRLTRFDRAWLLDLRAHHPSWASARQRALVSTSTDHHDRHLAAVLERLVRVETAQARERAA